MTMGWIFLPLATFVTLAILERALRHASTTSVYSVPDQILNLAGLGVQGVLVPLAGYLIATHGLALHWPETAGTLQIGWLGAFALNFVVVDFLYYWQHRLLHRSQRLWALHQCHHSSIKLNVWATSRNSLAINFLLVYMLVNPLFGFLCDRPDAFFAAAALTASLDLWRHSRLPTTHLPDWVEQILVTPSHHHLHHSSDGLSVNFGANLIVWDRLFGTVKRVRDYPATYGIPDPRPVWRQFLYPW